MEISKQSKVVDESVKYQKERDKILADNKEDKTRRNGKRMGFRKINLIRKTRIFNYSSFS